MSSRARLKRIALNGTALFNARVDWNGWSFPKGSHNFGGGASVGVADELHEVSREAHVG